MKGIFSHILILLFFAVEANSQVSSISMNNMERPGTELVYSREAPKAGDTLYLKVVIPQGWHINANRVLDDFLVPSKVEPLAEGMKFDSALWPAPLKSHNELLNVDLLLLQDSFTISLPINSISDNYDPYKTSLKFTYQACSNICLAPKTIEVSFGSISSGEKKNSYLNSGEIGEKPAKNSFFLYFLLALLGGLLLNVMPCVLPVLFLKIFDLVRRAGETERNMLKWGLATAGGIWSSFFVIAAIIFIVRLTGNAVGWGFQFQYPEYTATMALFIAIFALSFFGIFDIWMPGNVLKVWEKRAKEDGTRGAFAYGILLVLLSTPCSAPFLGTAIGFSFTASAFELILIFIAIATGLSFPYLILSIFPQWTKKLPKPGHWMVILKQFLGFPLLLTVVWLIWIFGKQTGATASLRIGLLLCVAVFFAWLSGLIAKPGKPWWRFAVLWLVFAAIYVFSWNQWIGPLIQNKAGSAETNIEDLEWLPFSSVKLDSLQNEGIAVWVNGMADWCITCKINEKNVFESEKIKEIFAKTNVVKMQADYTKPNYEALKFFEAYGRGGVPFDLLLTSSREALLMPELLTADLVEEALKKAY